MRKSKFTYQEFNKLYKSFYKNKPNLKMESDQNNSSKFNQSEEIECENDEYIVSLQNEDELEQKGYRVSTLDEYQGAKENEYNLEKPEEKINQNPLLNSSEIKNPENKIKESSASTAPDQKIDLSNFKTTTAIKMNSIFEKSPSQRNLSISKSIKSSLEKSATKLSALERESIASNYNTHSARENIAKKLDFDQQSNFSIEGVLYSPAEIEKLKEIVNQKISSLGNMHVFCLNNLNIILKIFKELTDILFRKIAATIDQNKKFLKYFKEIIESYRKFCVELERANSNITNLNDENQLLSDNITNLIVTTQDTIKTNFDTFSKNLNETLVANGPFQKIKDILARFEIIKKNVTTDFRNLEYKKEKMVKKFNSKSVPVFTSFKKFENKLELNGSTNLKDLANLFEENDFFLIEVEITLRINKLFNKLSIFLNSLKSSIGDLKKCVVEYASLVKDTVEKFLSENKKIYGGNMNLDFEHMQKFYESITKESLEKSFIVSRILGSDNTINKFNEFFNEYRNDLVKFRIVKDEVISKQDKFNISNFQSVEDLISFMLSLIPIERKLSSPLLIGKYDLKRDPGVFKSWKNCIVLKTLQNNLLIFDDVINKNPVEVFNAKKMKFKAKDDKKNPFKFEIAEKKKGVLFNSNKIQYFDAISADNFKVVKAALNVLD